MEGQDIILIVINGSDIASTNQADKLLEMGTWQVLEDVENKIENSHFKEEGEFGWQKK